MRKSEVKKRDERTTHQTRLEDSSCTVGPWLDPAARTRGSRSEWASQGREGRGMGLCISKLGLQRPNGFICPCLQTLTYLGTPNPATRLPRVYPHCSPCSLSLLSLSLCVFPSFSFLLSLLLCRWVVGSVEWDRITRYAGHFFPLLSPLTAVCLLQYISSQVVPCSGDNLACLRRTSSTFERLTHMLFVCQRRRPCPLPLTAIVTSRYIYLCVFPLGVAGGTVLEGDQVCV